MTNKNGLSVNLENYLETILDLQNTYKVARSKDIAERMGIKRGSVTSMLKKLADKGLINYEPYGFITLTSEGEKAANEIERRHKIIKDFLSRVLQIEDDTADATACRMEHTMDKSTVDRLLNFIDFIDTCPRTGAAWIQAFVSFCAAKKPDRNKCKECLEHCIVQFD